MDIHDNAMHAAQYALQGLQRRADVRAHNIANVNTPGFRAERVDFETSLREALERGRPQDAAEPIHEVDPNLPGPNENTVSVEGEMVGMIQDNLLRDAMVNAYNWKAGLLRGAATSR